MTPQEILEAAAYCVDDTECPGCPLHDSQPDCCRVFAAELIRLNNKLDAVKAAVK